MRKNLIHIAFSVFVLIIASFIFFKNPEKLNAGPCFYSGVCSTGCQWWYSGPANYCVYGYSKVLSCTSGNNPSCPNY